MADLAGKVAFITANLRLTPVPGLPEIQIYTAHPGSRLSRLDSTPPYWAYPWAGGVALARYVLDSGVAKGLRVLDFGSGSGLVAIAAAKAGAATVRACDCDPWAMAATVVNMQANGVCLCEDTAPADLVLCGDVFYSAEVAETVLPRLDAFRAKGARVLLGDPGRAHLPRALLVLRSEIMAHDMGDGPAKTVKTGIFDYRPDPTPDTRPSV